VFILIIKKGYLSLQIIYNLGIVSNNIVYNNSKKENFDNLLIPCTLHFDSYSDYLVSDNIADNIQK